MAVRLIGASPRPSRLSTEFLSPTESLAVVEIFINAALACICHSRQLIKWDSKSFRKRYIDDLRSDFWKDHVCKYSAFCDTEPSMPSGISQEFRILVRGETGRADSILDLIEPGIFPAIKGGLLETVRFFVTQGDTDYQSTDILESYSLDFSYEHDTTNSSNVRRISFNSKPIFTTDNAVKSFNRAIKSLLISMEGLPSLPRKRRLGVAMLYNDRCPSTYQAPGLVTESLSLAAEKQTGWHKLLLQKSLEVGAFEVGPYHVTVGAKTTRQSIEIPTSSQMRDLKSRVQLQSWQKSSSQQENSLMSTLEHVGIRKSHHTPATRPDLTSDMRSPLPSSQAVLLSSAMNESNQSRSSGMTRKSRKRNVIPTKLAELILKAHAIEAQCLGDNIFDLEDLRRNKITRLKSGGQIQCGCEDESGEGNLLTCTLCGTTQHMDCYGWYSFPRVKLPDEHFCYSCLLLPQEAELEAQMPVLIHKRLALAHIQANSPTNADCLMRAMRLTNTEEDHERFNEIMDSLQEDGYLARHGSAITATIDKELAMNVFRDIISPLAQVSHHFVVIKDDETATLRANAVSAALEVHKQNRPYVANQVHIEDEQQSANDSYGEHSQGRGFHWTLQKSRKRLYPDTPVEETPCKRNAGAGREAFSEEATSPFATPPPHLLIGGSARRMASRCEAVVCLDRSSPSTVFPMGGALDEAVSVASSDVQWEEFASDNGRMQ